MGKIARRVSRPLLSVTHGDSEKFVAPADVASTGLAVILAALIVAPLVIISVSNATLCKPPSFVQPLQSTPYPLPSSYVCRRQLYADRRRPRPTVFTSAPARILATSTSTAVFFEALSAARFLEFVASVPPLTPLLLHGTFRLRSSPSSRLTSSASGLNMDHLKTARASAKRAVTREINHTRQCMAEDDMVNIEECILKLKDLFKKFTLAHEEFHQTLVNEKEIDESDAYFFDKQEDYISTLNLVKNITKPREVVPENEVPIGSEMESLGKFEDVSRNELLRLLNLPKVELEVFDGNPLHYHQFIRAFVLK